jgi:predicted transcriptional regulator
MLVPEQAHAPLEGNYMKTPISSMMQRKVWSVRIDDSIESVERLLAEKRLTWVPVQEPAGAIVGVISASDLLQFHAHRSHETNVHAWQLCSYTPITVTSGTDVDVVAQLMVARGIHHVVVMDNGELAGVVSSLDFVRRFANGDVTPSP